MEKAQFDSLNDGRHSRVPVWRTVLADLDTPLSVYLKLADGSDSYLFESVEGGVRGVRGEWGRRNRRRYLELSRLDGVRA